MGLFFTFYCIFINILYFKVHFETSLFQPKSIEVYWIQHDMNIGIILSIVQLIGSPFFFSDRVGLSIGFHQGLKVLQYLRVLIPFQTVLQEPVHLSQFDMPAPPYQRLAVGPATSRSGAPGGQGSQ